MQFLKNVKNADFVLLQDVLQLQRMKMELVSIDQTLCNGCGLCMQNCHFDAIELKKKGE